MTTPVETMYDDKYICRSTRILSSTLKKMLNTPLTNYYEKNRLKKDLPDSTFYLEKLTPSNMLEVKSKQCIDVVIHSNLNKLTIQGSVEVFIDDKKISEDLWNDRMLTIENISSDKSLYIKVLVPRDFINNTTLVFTNRVALFSRFSDEKLLTQPSTTINNEDDLKELALPALISNSISTK